MGNEHVIPQFINHLHLVPKEGVHDFIIQGTGRETRSFLFIDDFVDAVLLLLAKGGGKEIYHIGTDEEISMGDVAERIAQQMNRVIKIKPGPLQKGSPTRRCPDTTKIKALGFTPRITLDQGLPSVIEWYTAIA